MLELTSGEYVVISTSDTGCGLTEEVQQRIFDPFFTTKEVGSGNGLGLATAYGVIRQSGGAIEVESAPGQGATFRIYLPRLGDREPIRASAPKELPDRDTRTILLAEDDDAILNLAARALRADGFEVLTSRDGVEALTILSQRGEQIDLVITDMVMPIIGGRNVINACLGQADGPRVMAVSGYSRLAVEEEYPELRFLPKPYTASELVDAARTTLT